MVDAVILAGGTIPDSEAEFREATGADCKSLVPLAGRIMVGHVIAALKAARSVGRVAVIGPPELQGHPDCAEADLVMPEGAGRSENFFIGLDAMPDAERVLMLTSDTPLVTGPMIDDVVEHLGDEVDLGWVYVTEETVLAQFADRPPPPPPDDHGREMPAWVTMELREGKFTGTPVMLCRPAAIRPWRPMIKGIFDDRYLGNIIRCLRPVFGLPFLLRLGIAFSIRGLRRTISVAELERRMSRGMGLVCRAYASPHAEMAFDVDHLTDVALAERVLQARTGAGP